MSDAPLSDRQFKLLAVVAEGGGHWDANPAGCRAQGRQARAPQAARQLLFTPQPANTISDKLTARREPGWPDRNADRGLLGRDGVVTMPPDRPPVPEAPEKVIQ